MDPRSAVTYSPTAAWRGSASTARSSPDPRFLAARSTCGAGERRSARRHLRRVLLVAGQPDLAGPRPGHGRGLGERPSSRRRQRLRRLPAGRPRPPPRCRGRHVLLRRQRARLGAAERGRRGHRRIARGRLGGGPISSRTEPVQPDTRHRFLVDHAHPVTHVRLDVYPDGGLARLRCNGEIDPDALDALGRGWWDSLPPAHRDAIGDYPM